MGSAWRLLLAVAVLGGLLAGTGQAQNPNEMLGAYDELFVAGDYVVAYSETFMTAWPCHYAGACCWDSYWAYSEVTLNMDGNPHGFDWWSAYQSPAYAYAYAPLNQGIWMLSSYHELIDVYWRDEYGWPWYEWLISSPGYSWPLDPSLTPVITSLSPDYGFRSDNQHYMTISGHYFGANPGIQVTGYGVTVYPGYVSPDGTTLTAQFTVDQSAGSGVHGVSVVTQGGTSGAVDFTVGDQTPVITSIYPSTWEAGQTYTDVTISGVHFGLNPQLGAGSDVQISVNGSPFTDDNTIHATVYVYPEAQTGQREVTVTSQGWSGVGFIATSGGGQQATGNANVMVLAAACQFSIPTNGQVYTLGDDYLTGTVPLVVNSSCSGTASWYVVFEYQTSGSRGSSTAGPYEESSRFGQIVNFAIPGGVGGKAIATVTFSVIGTPPPPQTVTFYVVGRPIPENVITDILVAGYVGGARPRLFTGVADKESSYRQFASRSLYGQTAYWPLESYDGGSHVGLLMVSASMEHGYSISDNIADALSLFGDKLSICQAHIDSLRSGRPNLRDLTGEEYEMCALVKYGPHAALSWYWVPNGSNDNWIVDPDSTHAPAVAYANDVVERMR
jgi:hypothetical protein